MLNGIIIQNMYRHKHKKSKYSGFSGNFHTGNFSNSFLVHKYFYDKIK